MINYSDQFYSTLAECTGHLIIQLKPSYSEQLYNNTNNNKDIYRGTPQSL